ECLGFIGSQAIAFVEDHIPWNLFQVKLGQNHLDRLDLSLDISGACVHEMQQHIGIPELLQCGPERPNEGLRQISKEAHGIRDDNFLVTGKPESAAGRVECFEGTVLNRHMTLGERVQQSGFPCVGVADDGDDGDPMAKAASTALVSMTRKSSQLSFEMSNPVADPASIRLQLGLSRASSSDPTTQSRQCRASSRQPRQQIPELGQLNLDFPFPTVSP